MRESQNNLIQNFEILCVLNYAPCKKFGSCVKRNTHLIVSNSFPSLRIYFRTFLHTFALLLYKSWFIWNCTPFCSTTISKTLCLNLKWKGVQWLTVEKNEIIYSYTFISKSNVWNNFLYATLKRGAALKHDIAARIFFSSWYVVFAFFLFFYAVSIHFPERPLEYLVNEIERYWTI